MEICVLDLCFGLKNQFYGVFPYCILVFSKVCEYYIFVVIYDSWDIIRK